MSTRLVSRYCVPGLIIAVALLLGVLLYSHPAAGDTMSDTFAAFLADSVEFAAKGTRHAVGAVLPAAAGPHIRQFIAGLASPALVAQGLRVIPGTTAVTTGVPRLADIAAFRVEKFLYSLGGIVAELLLLHLFVRPRRTLPFSLSPSSASSSAFFTTHIGWWLLLLSEAVPNGVVEVGLVIALVARLPPETYTPAVVVGKLLQPYVAAALCSFPAIARLLLSPLWSTLHPQQVGQGTQARQEEWLGSLLKVALWVTVALTVLFFLARFVCSEPCASETDVVVDGVSSETDEDCANKS